MEDGGNEPTVTDADLVLGFLDGDDFLGGRMSLDLDRSVAVIESIADELGMDTIETASGIVEVMNAKMADMIRQRTVNEGYDPREFVLYAYGGAGPLHVPSSCPATGYRYGRCSRAECSVCLVSSWCVFLRCSPSKRDFEYHGRAVRFGGNYRPVY